MSDPRELLERAALHPHDDLDVADLRRRVARRRRRRLGATAGAAALVLLIPVLLLGPLDDVEVERVGPAGGPTAEPEAPGSDGDREGSWRTMSEAPVEGRSSPEGLWTGSELVIWGGLPRADGAAYDPRDDTWRELPDAPIDPRYGHGAAWTGREVLVWGGLGYEPPMDPSTPSEDRREEFRADGAAYDPAADTWRVLPPSPLSPRSPGVTAWTGDELLVFGGSGTHVGDSTLQDGAAYDPAADTWRPLADMPEELRVVGHGVWTDDELVVFETQYTGAVAAYDPDTDTWRRILEPPLNLGLTMGQLAVAWDGDEVLVAGGEHVGDGDEGSMLKAYDPAEDRWRTLADPPGTLGDPMAGGIAGTVWTGRQLLVSQAAPDQEQLEVYAYVPSSDHWTNLPETPLAGRSEPVMVWADTELLIWGGGEMGGGSYADGAVWQDEG